MIGFVQLLAVGLAAAVALSVVAVVRRMRNPPRRTYASALARKTPADPSEIPPPIGPREFRAFSFNVPGRGLHLPAWDIPGDNSAGPVVVCSPGWGDSKTGVLVRLSALLPWTSRVVAWDPEGLGDSPPQTRCNLGTEWDVRALCELVKSLGERRIILMGWSLGAGVSIVAAGRLAHAGLRPLAVIAEAPYRFARSPVENYLKAVGMPYRFAVPAAMAYLGVRLNGTMRWTSFDRAAHAAALPCPLLVIHGTLDAICPIDDGRRIAAAATRSLFIPIENAGHNDLWSIPAYRTQCERAIHDLIAARSLDSTA